MEKCAQFTLQLLSQLLVARGIGHYVHEPLAVPVRCLGLLFMAQCLVRQWVHAMRQLLVFFGLFLREGELVS